MKASLSEIDCFVIRHLDFLEGNMRLSSAPVKTKNQKTEPKTAYNEQDIKSQSVEEDPVENWKGLSVPQKRSCPT